MNTLTFPKTVYLAIENEDEEPFFVCDDNLEPLVGPGTKESLIGVYELKEKVKAKNTITLTTKKVS